MYALSVATPKDIPALLQLLNSTYRGEPSRKGWTTEADLIAGDVRTNTKELAELIARPGAVFLKICDKNSALGACVYLEKRDNRLYLGMFSVSPELQGQGLGKILLRGAEEQARTFGCTSIYMQVISLRHELIAWYERHGYRNTGEYRPFDAPSEFGVPRQPLEFVILEKVV